MGKFAGGIWTGIEGHPVKLHDHASDILDRHAGTSQQLEVGGPSSVSAQEHGRAAGPTANHAAPSGSLDLAEVLAAVSETAYAWNFATDGLSWHSNAHNVMGLSEGTDIQNGRSFCQLIAPAHQSRHEETIRHARAAERGANGTPYKICYRLGGDDEACREGPIWVEDRGRCWIGTDGQANRATGVIRRLETRAPSSNQSSTRESMDFETGLPNRLGFQTALTAHLTIAQQTARTGAIMMIDVSIPERDETSKSVDDDEALAIAFARKLKKEMRRSDIVGRIASNRFGVILVDCAPPAIGPTCKRVIDNLQNVSVQTPAGKISGCFSIGAVEMLSQTETANDLMDRAAEALTEAGKVPGTSFHVGTGSRHLTKHARQNKLSIAGEILGALDANRMSLVLQPLVCVKTGRAALYECLLRMELPDGRVVPAGEFIEEAERLGLWRLIDRRTLELAVGLAEQYDDLHLSLNVSSLTTGDAAWLASFRLLTEGRPSVARRLTIEITETEAIHDVEHAQHFISELRSLGCRIAIDDFGAGYTSFKNLKLLDVDMVKIDGSFVRSLATDPTDRIFIKTLVDLAQNFGIETVAEYVVDQKCAEILAQTGVTYLQGFHYGQPKPAAEYAAMVRDNDA